ARREAGLLGHRSPGPVADRPDAPEPDPFAVSASPVPDPGEAEPSIPCAGLGVHETSLHLGAPAILLPASGLLRCPSTKLLVHLPAHLLDDTVRGGELSAGHARQPGFGERAFGGFACHGRLHDRSRWAFA